MLKGTIKYIYFFFYGILQYTINVFSVHITIFLIHVPV